MKEAGCSDVQIKPPLLPVNPNDFRARTNTTDGARPDISARGLQSAFERTFFDVMVSHLYAASNVTVSLPALYARNEKEKRSLYQDRVLETSCLLDHRRLRTKLHQGYKAGSCQNIRQKR